YRMSLQKSNARYVRPRASFIASTCLVSPGKNIARELLECCRRCAQCIAGHPRLNWSLVEGGVQFNHSVSRNLRETGSYKPFGEILVGKFHVRQVRPAD